MINQAGKYFFTLRAVLMICAFVMHMAHFITIFIQGGKSVKAGTRLPEDAFMRKKDDPLDDADKEADKRWKRITTNFLETAPLGFVIFAIATFVVEREESRLGLIVVIPVFVFCRILYVICYAYRLQPFRTIVWMASILCILTAGLIAVIESFTNVDDYE